MMKWVVACLLLAAATTVSAKKPGPGFQAMEERMIMMKKMIDEGIDDMLGYDREDRELPFEMDQMLRQIKEVCTAAGSN